MKHLPRPEILGIRLRNARQTAGLTQDKVAQATGMARTTIVAIEAGKRSITEAELRVFAELYSCDEGDLLSDTRPVLDLQAQFRASPLATDAEQLGAIDLLTHLATSVLELEGLVGQSMAKGDLPRLSLGRDQQVAQLAEDAALEVRQRLGLGLSPISNVITLLEFDLGLRVFERKLAARISGVSAYDDVHGGFVLLNSNHPQSRRRQTAIHEMCHALLRKPGVSVQVEGQMPVTREDKFCDAFARAFLIPAVAARKKAAELKALAGELTVRHALMMALYFGVAMEAMLRRLEELDLVDKGMFESLRERGLKLEHLEVVRREMGAEPENSEITPRAALLAGAAYEKSVLSEQQIASKLALDLVSVRKLLEEVSS